MGGTGVLPVGTVTSPSAGEPRFPSRKKRPRPARLVPLLPATVLLAVFLLGPVVWSFYGSFTNSALTGAAANHTSFVGLDNYSSLFTSSAFPMSLLLTLIFVFASAVIGQNLIGLALAVLMRKSNKVVRAAVGASVVAAWVLPEIVAAFGAYAFFSNTGTLNVILHAVGLPTINWLYDTPMLAVTLANVWRGTAFSMMVYSAALMNIPPEITEAATVDGAGGWKRMWNITLPMIRRSISTNLMLITLQTLSVFTLIWVMTAGGPGSKSSTLPVLAYQEAFQFSNLGYGTAIATILLVVGAIFSIIYLRVLKPEVD
ncbi:carbohydrate ABC transporter permease [Arthrobacter silviterrae]|uniref:Sugar ABC transporter permease n=1 Tax=Arthrobacter silviterrae TaxID=2026658 RepID=A0ABX0DCA9_9MICC|nr:sugar ABC transporter permease [Arthrobacter silviterrae]NGN84551.1 sugar ABC transporter permease [Arthrobacter silviterrae]